jgi:RNA polymerase sigma factor (sigma-70 family)
VTELAILFSRSDPLASSPRFDSIPKAGFVRCRFITRGISKSSQMSGGLLTKIAAGDCGAVEECLARYGGLVWTLARTYLSNRAEAEEVVQEIFVDLWRHASRFDEAIASERTFITMIARRRLIDFRRKLQRTITTTRIPSDLSASGASVEESVAAGEEAEWARGQLARLKPIERRVIEMAIEEGLSHSQIAGILGIPLGTVKTNARTGMIHLRELFHQRAARHFVGGAGS